MNEKNALTMFPRTVIYVAMVVLLAAIFIGAANEAPPVFLAVGFIAEVILVATAHLSSVIQQNATR